MKRVWILTLAVFLLGLGSAAARSLSVNQWEAVDDPEAAYDARCTGPARGTEECGALKTLLYQEIGEELDAMQWTNIEDNIEPALSALALPDEEIRLKALLVLGKWAGRPEVQQAVRPLLFGRNLLLAYYAARILEKSPDPGTARLAGQLLRNRGDAAFHDPRRLYARPEHPEEAARRLPRYAQAAPLALADVYQSEYLAAGFATADSLEQVLAFYRQAFGQKELSRETLVRQQQERQQARVTDLVNNPKIKEMQELAAQYQKTLDPSLLVRLEAVGKEIDTLAKGGEEPALYRLAPPGRPGEPTHDSGRYFFPCGPEPRELVLVYRDQDLGQTVIQLAWMAERKRK